MTLFAVFLDIRMETVGGKVPRGRLERSAQDTACWRDVLNTLRVSPAPGLMGTAVTSRTWTLLWDRGAVAEQRMSASTQREEQGIGGLEQRRNWTESRGRGLRH